MAIVFTGRLFARKANNVYSKESTLETLVKAFCGNRMLSIMVRSEGNYMFCSASLLTWRKLGPPISPPFSERREGLGSSISRFCLANRIFTDATANMASNDSWHVLCALYYSCLMFAPLMNDVMQLTGRRARVKETENEKRKRGCDRDILQESPLIVATEEEKSE